MGSEQVPDRNIQSNVSIALCRQLRYAIHLDNAGTIQSWAQFLLLELPGEARLAHLLDRSTDMMAMLGRLRLSSQDDGGRSSLVAAVLKLQGRRWHHWHYQDVVDRKRVVTVLASGLELLGGHPVAIHYEFALVVAPGEREDDAEAALRQRLQRKLSHPAVPGAGDPHVRRPWPAPGQRRAANARQASVARPRRRDGFGSGCTSPAVFGRCVVVLDLHYPRLPAGAALRGVRLPLLGGAVRLRILDLRAHGTRGAGRMSAGVTLRRVHRDHGGGGRGGGVRHRHTVTRGLAGQLRGHHVGGVWRRGDLTDGRELLPSGDHLATARARRAAAAL
mmetsp:Transcript_27806/g.72786  ORF Transcript_27806/g.72786 Transcript_27806/m.72786 type:complete len:333 (+) Transcript_27806:78-1076(+)